MKLLRFAAVVCIAAFILSALGGCAGSNTKTDIAMPTEEAEVLSAKTFSADSTNVKLIGRTLLSNGVLWLAHSASGVEFTFSGTAASVTLVGDGAAAGTQDSQARFAVYVNGEKTLDQQIDSAEKTYEIFSSESETETTVKILKLSESANSTFGIRSIDVTCAGDIAPTAEKELKIEFIGDSITCGYGVDDEVKEHHFSTSTEDATRAYAYKTAQLLDADYSLVSYSGHGIISGYTGNGKKVTSQQVPKIYEQFAKTYGTSYGYYEGSTPWDFSSFVPDFVVINLGTNDSSYTGSDKEKIEDYTASYVEFIKTVRSNNPDAHIICTLGVMGDSLYPAVEDTVNRYTSETGDENVSAFHLTPQDAGNGFAADWHPTEASHEIAANELAEYIRSLM